MSGEIPAASGKGVISPEQSDLSHGIRPGAALVCESSGEAPGSATTATS